MTRGPVTALDRFGAAFLGFLAGVLASVPPPLLSMSMLLDHGALGSGSEPFWILLPFGVPPLVFAGLVVALRRKQPGLPIAWFAGGYWSVAGVVLSLGLAAL